MAGKGTKVGVGASQGVRASVGALLLLALDFLARLWALASLSYFSAGLIGRLTRGLQQAQNFGALAIELKSKEHDFSERAG